MTSSPSRRLALLGVVILGGGLAVFGLRPGVVPPSSGDTTPTTEEPAASEATPELAERAIDRLQLFRAGNAGPKLSLTSDEITALLRHSLPGVLPDGIVDPVVTLEGGVVLVEARLATADFVARAPLASVLGALPDTLSVDLSGRLGVHGDRLVFELLEAHAARVPLPPAIVAAIATDLAAQSGEEDLRAVGEPSLSVRWPSGVALVTVLEDRLVLHREEPKPLRAVDGSDDP